MQPRRSRRWGWIETIWLIGVVLVFALVGWAVRAVGRESVPAAALSANAQTAVADPPTWVADAPAFDSVTPYPPPYPPPLPTDVPLSTSVPSLPPPQGTPFNIKVCASSPYASELEFWVDHSEVIVIGTVVEVRPPRWTTPDGTRPAYPGLSSDTIYSPVVVEVEQYLKSEQPTQQIGILARGGQVGHDSVDFCGDQRYMFNKGSRVMLFLAKSYTWNETYKDLPLWDIADHWIIANDWVVSKPRYNGDLNAPLSQVLADIEAALNQ